jgi:hypothetical protein
MVSFRLSEDEYTRLRDQSLAGCARSVSEFARAALCRIPGVPAGLSEPSSNRLEHLEGTVRQLGVDLLDLRRLVETLRGHELAPNGDAVEARQQ